MPYNPTIPPINKDDLQRWLADELNKINPDILVSQEYFSFTERSVEPKKPLIGQIVFADGVGWDPGAGQGMYEYTDLGWAKLGGGNGNVIPTSHSALQDLLVDDHPQYFDQTRGDARYYTQTQIDSRQLQDLLNVVLTSVQDNDVLTYNSATLQWENEVAQGGDDTNADGGFAGSVYIASQLIDGGFA